MTSYFEQLFKQMFIQRYSHINNVEDNIKGRPIKIASEYKKILDKVAIGMIYDSFENEKIIDASIEPAPPCFFLVSCIIIEIFLKRYYPMNTF